MKRLQLKKIIFNPDSRSRALGSQLCFLLMVLLGTGVASGTLVWAAPVSKVLPVVESDGRGWTPELWKDYLKNDDTDILLPDFSRAGYGGGDRTIPDVAGPVFNVTDVAYGAVPGDLQDDTLAIQAAIDDAQVSGGLVFLPKGRYDIRKNPVLPPLRITGSNIVIRGEGEGQNGTVLRLWSPAHGGNVRRLGSVPAEQAARSGAVISVMGGEKQDYITSIIEDVRRGESIIRVADSSSLHPGQFVVISLEDPLVDGNDPRPEKVAIALALTRPYTLIDEQKDTFGKAAQIYTWTVRIAEIIDRQTIRLKRPARFDQLKSYHPKILAFGGVREVGIEHLRIESSWPGNYRHHKPYKDEKGVVVRTAREQDYLWNGIWLSHAVDSWVRDVTFTNLTQGIIASHVAESTFEKLTFLGQAGHAGITMGRSNEILVSQVHFYAPLVHPVTLTMMSSGNVFTDSATHYDGRNELSGTDAVIDFHGMFPFENLFDNVVGFYVCPGGDMSVLPHGGVRNVFWNIVAPENMSCYTGKTDDEFVRTYATAGTTSHSQATMYEHLPQAFFIGITRKGGRAVTIGQSGGDRKNQWHVVEGLGRKGIAVKSLYQAQLERRHTTSR